LGVIPEDARRVGLVGAAVSDHPKIVEIVNTLADRGCEVGLSSLRPDRLASNEDFVAALARVGYRTLTTAMDGTSERVRERLDRLRGGVRGRVDVRATGARWAWVEYVLAQGGAAEGLALIAAVEAGGSFQAYRRAFGERPNRVALAVV